MSNKVYIAGSISNNDTVTDPLILSQNIEAFHSAANALTAEGYEPINPARRGKVEGKPWLSYMRDSLRDIADCDGIALLDGWENSRGAQIERELAADLGIPVFPLSTWLGQDGVSVTVAAAGRFV